ncbi:MAG: peptidylprolyl isomerase [Candidatus Woesearchaeota archaeon]
MKKENSRKAKIIHYSKEQKNNFKILGWIIIILLVVALGFYTYKWINDFQGFNSKSNNSTEDNVIVLVNGEEILESYVDSTWNNIPVETKVYFTREMLIEELIEEKLIMQKANELNIKVSDEEVDEYVMIELTNMQMTYEDFEEIISQQGLNINEVKEIYRKQLTIAKLFEQEIQDDLLVTDVEIQDYYETNKEQFFENEQVTVKHILIALENETMNKEREELIMNKLNSGINFCDLVQNYSSDFASVGNCGEYTFSRGQMTQEFEDTSFNMNVGDIQSVETEYGIHIINKLSEIKKRNLTLDDVVKRGTEEVVVKEVVKEVVTQQKASQAYDNYVAILKENAEIEYVDNTNTENSDNTIETFAKCLTEKGAKMYGAYWCSHCNAQKESFGEAVTYINYVECDSNGENSQYELCSEMNIEGFPTWIIDGKQYAGRQTHEKLAEITGCEMY